MKATDYEETLFHTITKELMTSVNDEYLKIIQTKIDNLLNCGIFHLKWTDGILYKKIVNIPKYIDEKKLSSKYEPVVIELPHGFKR